MMLHRKKAIEVFNNFGSHSKPFSFLIDFTGQEAYVDSEGHSTFLLQLGNQSGTGSPSIAISPFKRNPPSYERYLDAFQRVQRQISIGNSFLVNLTFETPIAVANTLAEIFLASTARYKVLFEDRFVCFSPETFVKISAEGQIKSFPMKGTIDASLPGAKTIILSDLKETAEHVTIVDLIRNDLSQVARDVKVPRFRYVEQIRTNRKNLLQVSSEVTGQLDQDWKHRIGDILFGLLPAGSISGAPKPKTVEIIHEIEGQKRGFYTGVCGHFDGHSLDSGVMIRFIEQKGNTFTYKSGGGITSFSDPEKEYHEMLDKIYVPVF